MNSQEDDDFFAAGTNTGLGKASEDNQQSVATLITPEKGIDFHL